MADRWYYVHEGQTRGPTTAAEIRRLAAAGQLFATDLIWAEGQSRDTAIPLEAAFPLPASVKASAGVPDWLGDVRSLENLQTSAGAAKPAWLENVQPAAPVPASVPVAHRVAPPAPPATPAPSTGLPPAPKVATALKSAPSPVTPKASTPTPKSGPPRLTTGSATSPGMARDRNEDSLLVLQATWVNLDRRHDLAAVAIADGMGGHQSGERASGHVIGAMSKVLGPLLAEAAAGLAASDLATVMVDAINRAFQEAHRQVADTARADPGCKGMGATAVALLAWDDQVHIGLVGDCRVYHQRGGQITQVTRDQTIVARMVELGQLTPAEAAEHPRRNEVTQAVGQRSTIEPVGYALKLSPGDWLIAACDGLYAHVDTAAIQEAAGRPGMSPALLASTLVDLANQGGGSDNCTVVALSYQ
jgi:serine/threonine protein phosphatase PrpC